MKLYPPLPFPLSLSGKTHCGVVDRNLSQDPEVALNKHNQTVKNLIQKLGEAIHETVSESEDIAHVVREIRDQGFDVILMLEATIGLNQIEEADEAGTEEAVDGPFTRNDLSFLKSLRITTDEHEGSDAS